MKFAKSGLAGVLAGIIFLTTACGTTATQAPPTEKPAETIALPTPAEPTQTPEPATPAPAGGETPAATSDSSIPAIVNENLIGVSVMRTDPFDTLDANIWGFDPALTTASGGNANITGNKNWTVGLQLKRPVLEGQAILIKFQMAKGTNFGIRLSNGTPGTPEYRSYGFYRPQAVMLSQVFQGTEDIRKDMPLKGDLKVHKFNTWYYCLLGVHPNGHFILLVWDAADPTQFNRSHDVLDETWFGKQWTYAIDIHDGKLMVDEALELQYTGIQ